MSELQTADLVAVALQRQGVRAHIEMDKGRGETLVVMVTPDGKRYELVVRRNP